MSDIARVLLLGCDATDVLLAHAILIDEAGDALVGESAVINSGSRGDDEESLSKLGLAVPDNSRQTFETVRDRIFDLVVFIDKGAERSLASLVLPGQPKGVSWNLSLASGRDIAARSNKIHPLVQKLAESAKQSIRPARASNRPGIATMAWGSETEFVPAECLPLAAAAGFVGLELCLLCGRQHFDHHDHGKVRELKRVADDLGMMVWSVHEQDIAECLGVADPSERRQAADEVKRCLDVAHEVDARAIPSHLLLNPKFEVDSKTEANMEKRIADELLDLAADVRDSGARIAFENTGRRPWAWAPAVFRRMAELPKDAYGFVLDTGHSNLAGDFDTIADLVEDRLITLHMHDNHGTKDEHLPPGDGVFDWAKHRALLARTQYQGCLMYEVTNIADGQERPPDELLREIMRAHGWIFELGRGCASGQSSSTPVGRQRRSKQ
jgi:sugar phosphate isomerase/epimerase